MTSPTLTFLGAARTVTGSKYLGTKGERRVLVDAGMFQGEKRWRLRNWEDFPVDPATITDVVLTHAHADHCGYLPALVRRGFAGPVWCSEGTLRLAEIVLRDAGYLAERDAKEAREGGWSRHDPPLPIYTTEDVEATLPLLRPVPFAEKLDLGDGIGLLLTRAGHILGSASVTLDLDGVTVLFSGDLGRADHPVLRPLEQPPGADHVIVESTYGDRDHPSPPNLPHEALAGAVRRTVERGGSVLVPAFAVDRTEVVLRTLSEMRRHGRIPEVPIYLNSPMATDVLEVYRRSHDELRPDLHIEDLAKVPGLVEVRSTEESMRLTSGARRRPSIIVSASGMVSGGRVLHHLERMLPDSRNAIVLTGYQAVGTRGRALTEGARQLKMHGAYVPVRAEIVQDREFSVHADRGGLLSWVRGLDPAPSTIYVTHGEEVAAEAFAETLRREVGCPVVVPSYEERVLLTPAGGPTTTAAPAAEPAAPIPSPGSLSDGRVVATDLRVRERHGDEVVLEGTITLRLG